MASKRKTYESGNRAAFLFLGILLLVAGALALLSVIGKTDSTLFASLREICYGSAGSLSLGIGIILIWLGLMSAFSAGRSVSKREFVLCFLIFLCVLAIINLMSRVQLLTFPDYIVTCNKSSQVIDPESFGSVLMGAYRECSRLCQGGGLLGMLLAYPAWKLGGVTFGTVLVGLLTIVLVVLLVKIDVRGITDKLQHKSELRAQEREHRRREREHQERLQEQERRRIEDDQKLRSPAYQRRTQPVYQPSEAPQGAYDQPYAQQAQAAYQVEYGQVETQNQPISIPPWLQTRNADQPVLYDEVVSDQQPNFLQRLGDRLHIRQETGQGESPASQSTQQKTVDDEMELYRQRIRGSEAAARDRNINVYARPVDEEFPRQQVPAVGYNPYAVDRSMNPQSSNVMSGAPLQEGAGSENAETNPYMRPASEPSNSESEQTVSEPNQEDSFDDSKSMEIQENQTPQSAQIASEENPQESSFEQSSRINIYARPAQTASARVAQTTQTIQTTPSVPYQEHTGTTVQSSAQEAPTGQSNRINIYARPAQSASAPASQTTQTKQTTPSVPYPVKTEATVQPPAQEVQPEAPSGQSSRINIYARPALSSSTPASQTTPSVPYPVRTEATVQLPAQEAQPEATTGQSSRINIYARPAQSSSAPAAQTTQAAQITPSASHPVRTQVTIPSSAQISEQTSTTPNPFHGMSTEVPSEQEQSSQEAPAPQKGYGLFSRPTQQSVSQRNHNTESSEPSSSESIQSKAPVPSTQAANPYVRNPGTKAEANTQPYTPPSGNLLNAGFTIEKGSTAEEDKAKAKQLEKTLQSFGIPARVERVTHGPAVTRFELGLTASGINVKRIQNLDGNIAMDMASNGGVRIEIPIPGTNLFGIEVPHQEVESVTLSEVLFSEEMKNAKSPLTVAIGKDISGKPVLCDLAKMPHLLIAGQTGSGKSVCINAIINSLIYRVSPEEVRFIMVDPKVVELQCYNGIPHLLAPVVNDPHKAAGILTWVVGEMLDRYHKMTTKGVREISAYNAKLEPDEPKIPRIVVIIDELSDLMMACRKDIEDKIIRIAQLSRAAGIHMVLATQRPTVDVITGLIKANVPSRIAFSVASATDSRTILDQNGAEKLLGRGDMFYFPTGAKSPIRVQGCFLSDGEIERIVNDVKSHGESDYDPNVVDAGEYAAEKTGDGGISPFDAPDTEGVDPRLPEAIQLVMESNLASISMLQRRMKIGHPRAGSLMDAMAERGIVSQDTGSKPREILITREEYERIKDSLF